MESDAITTANNYFAFSNSRDLDQIKEMIMSNATYSSDNTGLYSGIDQIMEMKNKFYSSFKNLHWNVTKKEEIKPGIVEFHFLFSAENKDGEVIHRKGIERMVIVGKKLRHIEVRNV